MKLRNIQEHIGFGILRLCIMLVISALVIIIWDIVAKGHGAISWQFITDMPRKGMTEGGVFPAIVGTPAGVFWSLHINQSSFAPPWAIRSP